MQQSGIVCRLFKIPKEKKTVEIKHDKRMAWQQNVKGIALDILHGLLWKIQEFKHNNCLVIWLVWNRRFDGSILKSLF